MHDKRFKIDFFANLLKLQKKLSFAKTSTPKFLLHLKVFLIKFEKHIKPGRLAHVHASCATTVPNWFPSLLKAESCSRIWKKSQELFSIFWQLNYIISEQIGIK
tara:strand:- start:760 stop:1071 length:312 start_codon:yes stop_codon:yes gene_type:complete